jgi:hypothetical protein
MIDENDEDEIVLKDTQPLPYVQVGMKLVCPDDGATWWEVEDIYEDKNEVALATLRSNDVRRITEHCPTLRHRWRLYEDFDPRGSE